MCLTRIVDVEMSLRHLKTSFFLCFVGSEFETDSRRKFQIHYIFELLKLSSASIIIIISVSISQIHIFAHDCIISEFVCIDRRHFL